MSLPTHPIFGFIFLRKLAALSNEVERACAFVLKQSLPLAIVDDCVCYLPYN